jgi:hypothetical protein
MCVYAVYKERKKEKKKERIEAIFFFSLFIKKKGSTGVGLPTT